MDIDLKELKSTLVARTYTTANEFKYNNNKMTAFHFACYHDITNLVTYGVNNPNVDVNLVDKFGQSALTNALNSNSRKVLNILIKCNRINYYAPNDSYSITLVEYIMDCYKKYDEFKKVMSNKNRNININAKNSNNDAAIHCACKTSHIDALKLLIEDLHANINLQGNKNMTPLMITCSRNFDGATIMLLNNVNIDVNKQDNNGNTALHHACRNLNDNSYNIIKTLMDHSNIDLNISNNDGYTPFMILCNNSSFKITENRYKINDIIDMFLNNNDVDKEKTNQQGHNAFGCALDMYDNYDVNRSAFMKNMFRLAESDMINALKK